MTVTVIETPPVEITVGQHRVLIDAEDRERVFALGLAWAVVTGHTGKRYVIAHRRGRTYYLHRIVAQTPAGMETDHENGDGLDNRRANLRTASCGQNSANAGKPRLPGGRTPTSQYKGVSWDRARQRWSSKIRVDGLSRNLGRYDVEADAARAYDAAAAAAWGSFARLNFPTEDQR